MTKRQRKAEARIRRSSKKITKVFLVLWSDLLLQPPLVEDGLRWGSSMSTCIYCEKSLLQYNILLVGYASYFCLSSSHTAIKDELHQLNYELLSL